MNRRDLLKRAALVPVAIAAAPLLSAETVEAAAEVYTDESLGGFMARYNHQTYAIAFSIEDGVALNSMAHPVTQPLSAMDGELSEDSLETIEIDLPEHEFIMGGEVCIHCREPAYAIKNGDVPLTCWRNRP